MDINRFVVISGCSSGGKSTLLAELGRRGQATAEEPGRRIVKQELAGEGSALPWINGAAFARRAIELAVADRSAAADVDTLGQAHRYHRRVFLAPPWPEIYVTDPERRHGFDEAIAEYHRLLIVYPSLGYEVVLLPMVSAAARADFILHTLAG